MFKMNANDKKTKNVLSNVEVKILLRYICKFKYHLILILIFLTKMNTLKKIT